MTEYMMYECKYGTTLVVVVVVVWVRFVSVRHGVPVHPSIRISTGTIYFKRGSQVFSDRSSFDSLVNETHLTPRTVCIQLKSCTCRNQIQITEQRIIVFNIEQRHHSQTKIYQYER